VRKAFPEPDPRVETRRGRGVTIVGEALDLDVIGRRLGLLADPWGNLIELAQTLPA
jgi:lactoylglutathione lyase/glyoxylase I family protein